ncbi:MAG: ATP-grasp domain-containing protein [Deltaproteobacteria bacterium]|nr:ATP-grasp domain-containing protein [Deltaproteobacteria bacterium]
MRILITSIGRKVFLVRHLREGLGAGCRVVTVDMSLRAPGRLFSDGFYQVPAIRDPGYIDRVLEIAEREKIDLIIPFKDTELGLFAAQRDDFESIGTRLMLSDAEAVLDCEDKLRTLSRFRNAGVRTPEIRTESDPPRFPAVWKQRGLGVETSGFAVVSNERELQAVQVMAPEGILQEYIDGREYTLDVYCDHQYRPRILVPRERLALRSYVTDIGRTAPWEPFLEEVERITQAFRLEGVINIQVFVHGEGHTYLEINPRISGGFHLSLQAGFDLVAALRNYLLGEDLPPGIGRYKVGLTMARYDEAVFFEEP